MKRQHVAIVILFCCFLFSCSKQTPVQQGTPEITPVLPEKQETLTMAVISFENIGQDKPFENIDKDKSFKNLGTDLIAKFTKNLKEESKALEEYFRDFEIVQKVHVNRLMEELVLSETSLIDTDTANRMGKRLNAQVLFYGGFFRLGKRVYVNGHFYRVETAELIGSLGGNFQFGNYKEYDQLVQNVSSGIIEGIKKKSNALTADILYEKGRNAEANLEKLNDAVSLWREALKVYPNHIGSLAKLKGYGELEEEEEEELGIAVMGEEKLRIAVMPFYIQPDSPKLMVLQKGLIDAFTTELSKSPHLKIVERQRLEEKIVEELNLSTRHTMDTEIALKKGKVLGATFLCFGWVTEVFGTVTVYTEMWHVERGTLEVDKSGSSKADKLPKELDRIVKDISAEISRHVEDNHPQLLADVYYEKGVNYEKANEPEKAMLMYLRALEITDDNHEKASEASIRVTKQLRN